MGLFVTLLLQSTMQAVSHIASFFNKSSQSTHLVVKCNIILDSEGRSKPTITDL